MPLLQWRNDADGFAFANSWNFDAAEKGVLSGIAATASPPVIGALAAFVPDPLFLTGAFVALQAYIAIDPLPAYGLCGGMAFSSLDHWNARVPIPRGAHAGDQPVRSGRGTTGLREVIWARLMDSLTAGGVMARTIEWTFLLNQVPAFLRGGAPELLRRTKLELAILRAHIDAGRPWPIGLIYDNASIWEQHQVLVFGYEDLGPNRMNLFVYDNNVPAPYAQVAPSLITLNLGFSTLNATTPGDVPGTVTSRGRMLAGLFCSNYTPAAPTTLARTFGEFVTSTNNVGFFQMTGGARLAIADAAELGALGGNTSASVLRSAGPLSPVRVRPRDGIMFRERSATTGAFLFCGGSPFRLPDQAWIDRFGGSGAVRVVANGAIASLQGPCDEGTLLREFSDPKVYRIMSGVRRWVTTPAELSKYGGGGNVRVVPDGALASIPEGPLLPTPGASECTTLRTKIAALTVQIARAEDALSSAPTARDAARIRGALANKKRDREIARARAALLRCP
jgi:hypothetical protein